MRLHQMLLLITSVLAAQPVQGQQAHPDSSLQHVLQSVEPNSLLRIGLVDSSILEGRISRLQGSNLLLRTPDESMVPCDLSQVVLVQERGVSKARGRVLGALVLGAAGAVIGLFAEILQEDGPVQNSDLIASSAVYGAVGMGIGVVVGAKLDPGRPGGWEQRYPLDSPPPSGQWSPPR